MYCNVDSVSSHDRKTDALSLSKSLNQVTVWSMNY